MDGRTPGVWCVLALLVVSAAVSHADVASIALDSMTWTADILTVCSGELSPDATIFRLAANADPLTDTEGVIRPDNATCVDFDLTDLPPEPLPNATTYELTAFDDSIEELQSGSVTFAFPLSQGTKIECGSIPFTRFSVEDGGGPALDGSNCLTDSTTSVCYISGEEDPVCVTGLDQQGNTDFAVCVPSDTTNPPADATISAVSLAYAEDRIGGTFTISSDIDMSTNSLELLSVDHDITDPPRVTTCEGNVCTFDSGVPSPKLYDLCSVYVANDGSVTSVGNYSFQDLQLTVDVVVDTVDFRFANKNADDNYVYHVYGDDVQSPALENPSFTLDCSHINEDSFCNGFFDSSPLPTHIGVSFISKNNVVIAPTIPTTTTTSTTTTTTAATTTTAGSVHLPRVKEDAMDLTDQNTEDIVLSSA